MPEALLELRDVWAGYGKITALKGVSLKVFPGEIVSIIGANGAGKSTTLMTICNVVKASKGEIFFDGKNVRGVSSDKLPPMGLTQVPEGRRIFPRLTVLENLEMGAYHRKDKETVEADLEEILILFPRLKERCKQQGGTLSGGEQQMLAIGRAIMSRPKLMLLDEPSLGLAPLLVQQIFDTIKSINESEGVTILLVEQNANVALSMSARGYVMETGEIVMEDVSEKLLSNEDIRKAYLGEL